MSGSYQTNTTQAGDTSPLTNLISLSSALDTAIPQSASGTSSRGAPPTLGAGSQQTMMGPPSEPFPHLRQSRPSPSSHVPQSPNGRFPDDVPGVLNPARPARRHPGVIGDSRPVNTRNTIASTTVADDAATPVLDPDWRQDSFSIPGTPVMSGVGVVAAGSGRQQQQQQQIVRMEPALPLARCPEPVRPSRELGEVGPGPLARPAAQPRPLPHPARQRGNCAVRIYGLSSNTAMRDLFAVLEATGKVYTASMFLRLPGTAGRDSANYARVEFWTPEGAAACIANSPLHITSRDDAGVEETRATVVVFDTANPARRREPAVRSRVIEVTGYPENVDPTVLGRHLTAVLAQRGDGGTRFEVVRVARIEVLRDRRERWYWEFCSVPELAVPVFDILFQDRRYFARYLPDPCQ
ncbi:hypothetical protein F5X99DRAFT_429322 [Biscogniauxia marginata]|nr:hypothetical protein F5X99DRAFT_429322 [Biscogniauxia marginata]